MAQEGDDQKYDAPVVSKNAVRRPKKGTSINRKPGGDRRLKAKE
jgi:hypothetical protein